MIYTLQKCTVRYAPKDFVTPARLPLIFITDTLTQTYALPREKTRVHLSYGTELAALMGVMTRLIPMQRTPMISGKARKLAGLILATAVLSFCSSAYALFYHAEFPLSPGQEIPPVASPASGQGVVDYDTVTDLLSWSISYTDLLGDLTAAHFHGPALPTQNAGVQVGLSASPSPIVGSTTISDAQGADLLNELWYVNLHTSQFPSGELRGQVVGLALARGDDPVPEPTGLGLLGLGLLTLRRRRR